MPNGQPVVDETVLSGLTQYPEAKAMAEFLMLSKRLGQLSYGREAAVCLKRRTNTPHHSRRRQHSRNNHGSVFAPPAKRGSSVGVFLFGYECVHLYPTVEVHADGWL